MKKLLMILLITGMFMLSACTKSSNIHIANPASQFCIDNGGTLDIKTADDGSQTGYCTKDGKVCEEWAFMRGECTIEKCAPCPQYIAPAPDFCKNGTFLPSVTNLCGCLNPPKCVARSTNVHICTPVEKTAEACTMDYRPVCGANGINYGNGCGACAAKVSYWIEGECASK